MPKLTIDRREVEVPEGATLLDAAQKLNINIPTLCYLESCDASTSCLVCTVKILGNDRLVPSCGTVAVEGMEVESETEEVHQIRRSALELLLSDHLGDCLAPCFFGCPARMDIPTMLRQFVAGELREAIVTVKNDIALPAVLGRICPAPCEKVCRRSPADGAVAICRLKRFVADTDLASGKPYLPLCQSASGKRVAIVGAGPAGLAAAYYLARHGHGCTILDENDRPGGRLRTETSEEELPPDVLDAEIETILRLGIEHRPGTRVGDKAEFDRLRSEFDAVLIACGATAKEQAGHWGLTTAARGVEIDGATYRTGIEGVFAAGNATRNKGMVVRSAADGKEAAVAIDQFLAGQPVTGPRKPFNVRIGRLEDGELQLFLAGASEAPPVDSASFSPEEAVPPAARDAVAQAARCLHCDCRGLHTCKLRAYSDAYRAAPRHYKAKRRTFEQDRQHAEVIFEPGKCIDCGLCIAITQAGGESLGLTFIGRGFDVRVGVPLSGSLRDALTKTAARCIEACPTAALSWAR